MHALHKTSNLCNTFFFLSAKFFAASAKIVFSLNLSDFFVSKVLSLGCCFAFRVRRGARSVRRGQFRELRWILSSGLSPRPTVLDSPPLERSHIFSFSFVIGAFLCWIAKQVWLWTFFRRNICCSTITKENGSNNPRPQHSKASHPGDAMPAPIPAAGPQTVAAWDFARCQTRDGLSAVQLPAVGSGVAQGRTQQCLVAGLR